MNKTIHVPLDFVIRREASLQSFDGNQDDLLTGGAGFAGFLAKSPPPFKNPESPTAQEIRTRAIWGNYRALMDIHDAYYGRFYGPGCGYRSPEKIPGTEYLALMEGGVTVMLQVPSHFNPDKPWLVSVPSSGSRGVYGGIGVVGEWALKRGFAVVYTDKGTGVGYHILDTDRVCLINGQWSDASSAGTRSTFTAVSTNSESRKKILGAHRDKYPHRIAVKHAHSRMNLQKDWGLQVLRSIRFARTILEMFHPGINNRMKTLAAGISNGGLSAIMAREMDRDNLIDAIAVSEPNVTPFFHKELTIVQGSLPPVKNHSMDLADYATIFNIFQPCASLAPEAVDAPYRFDAFGLTRAMCEERCRSLKNLGLLKGETIEDLSRHAAEIIRSSGTLPDQDYLLPSHYTLDVNRSIAVTYISQYACADVTDHLAGYSFAAVDEKGAPRAMTPMEEAALFSDQSGIPPFGVIKLINDLNPEGPCEDRISASPSTGRHDMNLDGALRLRGLVTGCDETGRPLTEADADVHKNVVKGMGEVRVTGNLNGCPAIIVTGRSDAVLPINHTSRPYVGVNRIREGENSRLRYYEITGAHHVDALNMLYRDTKACSAPRSFVPLHVYYLKSLDMMIDHMENGTRLPDSQVIRPENPEEVLPDIRPNPGLEERIRFECNTLIIPE